MSSKLSSATYEVQGQLGLRETLPKNKISKTQQELVPMEPTPISQAVHVYSSKLTAYCPSYDRRLTWLAPAHQCSTVIILQCSSFFLSQFKRVPVLRLPPWTDTG